MRAKRRRQLLQNAIEIRQDVVVPETKHAPAAPFEEHRATRILVYFGRVLPAVELDDKLTLSAGKIHDVATDRHLSPKLQSVERRSLR